MSYCVKADSAAKVHPNAAISPEQIYAGLKSTHAISVLQRLVCSAAMQAKLRLSLAGADVRALISEMVAADKAVLS